MYRIAFLILYLNFFFVKNTKILAHIFQYFLPLGTEYNIVVFNTNIDSFRHLKFVKGYVKLN